VLLLVSLFLDWYKRAGEDGLSGWTSFEVLDLVLAALAVLALVAAAERFGHRPPRAAGLGLTPIGILALVIVASQLLNHPPLGVGRSPELGAWLALGAAALIAAAGALGRARISFEVVSDRDTAQDTTAVESSARAEAAAEEPKVERELYPQAPPGAPLGADDPEPFRAGPEDETRRIG
jgi:hypothetical protein